MEAIGLGRWPLAIDWGRWPLAMKWGDRPLASLLHVVYVHGQSTHVLPLYTFVIILLALDHSI